MGLTTLKKAPSFSFRLVQFMGSKWNEKEGTVYAVTISPLQTETGLPFLNLPLQLPPSNMETLQTKIVLTNSTIVICENINH